MHVAAGMRKRWRWQSPLGEDAERESARVLMERLGLHPLAARLLVRRGVAEPDAAERFLDPKLTHLHDPGLLPGVRDAAARIVRAIEDGQPIVVYGDYDVDGITASATLWHTLRLLGGRVSTYVPHRIDEGYGLNVEAIRKLAGGTLTDGDAPLIISVDCGITATEPAAAARDAGADLIITDHHEFDASAALPRACAIVHPRLPGGGYPFADLCGAGVAFKLAWQVARMRAGSERVPAAMRDLLMDCLSLVALGTIADVVPLVDENRTMAIFGLRQIKRTRFVGLNALIDAAALREETVDAYHVGFVLGPRLNACGRMGHARQAVHLLTAAQHNEAIELADFLTGENQRRRKTERDIYKQAERQVLDGGWDSPEHRAIVVAGEGWHAGVVGIVASRLVERFARPAVVLAVDNGTAHGSARSVPGVSIHEALTHCAGHLTTFGGHAMAAGLRLETPRIDAFRRALIDCINGRLAADDLVGRIDVDAACTMPELDMELFRQVQRLAPFGRGNPAPRLWLRGARLHERDLVGTGGRHLRLTLTDGRRWQRAIAFGLGDLLERLPRGAGAEVVFEPRVSIWQGRPRPEMHVADVRLA